MRALLLIGLLLFVGCSSEKAAPSEVARRLQLVAQMFSRYTASHQGKTPANEKLFKEYINGLSASEKSALGITSADELLTSPTDHKPFIVRYGLTGDFANFGSGSRMAPGKGPPPPAGDSKGGPNAGPNTTANRQNLFAAEASGAKRYVVFATGQVEQLDESEVLKLLK